MTTEQAVYLAAAIDGEGYLGLVPIGRHREGHHAPGFSFRVSISNTDRSWLDTLQQWAGGYVELRSAVKGNRKPCYVLRFNGATAKDLLMRVMPYLILKKPRAELILRYFELAAQRRSHNSPGTPSNPTVVQAILDIHAQLKLLNQRGLVASAYAGPQPTTRICSIDGCETKHYSNGYCRQHYRRYCEHGGFKVYERTCVNCGRPFVARRKDTECCSKPCTDRHQYVKNQEARNAYKRAWRAKRKATVN